MRSTDEIINKEFSHSFMGYDMREVDCFLDEIIERFEKLELERKEMLTAMEYLLKKVEALGGAAENGDGRRLAAAESAFARLNGGANQSVPAGPVRVQAGSPAPERRQPKRREKPPQEPAVPEPEAAPVAIEMETEEFAPDMDELLPELLDDMEAVMDAGRRRALQQDRWEAEGADAEQDRP